MTALLFCLSALANDWHAGVPVQGVPELGAPSFLTPDLGWTAPVDEGGFVRVFVGQDAEEAARWIQQAQMAITVPLPPINDFGDEAYGDLEGLMLIRDRNVAIQVRAEGDAAAVVQWMLAAIPDAPLPWPQPPQLVKQDGTWVVSAPWAVHVQFSQGGRTAPGATLRFTERPGQVVAWDVYGRPAVLQTQ